MHQIDVAGRAALYVVATPIGNLEDITLRALRVLKEAAVVLAEDTRVTRKLFERHTITTPLERFDAVVEGKKIAMVVDWLEDGKNVALVSDAGTPGVSDPGARLVRAVREAGFEIFAVPGPSAVTAALSVSGISADQFVFLGFPPHKKGRKTFFEQLAQEERTIVFFESTHRIIKTLASLVPLLRDERPIVLLSELTKIHEEALTGTAEEIRETLEENTEKQKGEFVVVVKSKA